MDSKAGRLTAKWKSPRSRQWLLFELNIYFGEKGEKELTFYFENQPVISLLIPINTSSVRILVESTEDRSGSRWWQYSAVRFCHQLWICDPWSVFISLGLHQYAINTRRQLLEESAGIICLEYYSPICVHHSSALKPIQRKRHQWADGIHICLSHKVTASLLFIWR